MRVLLIFTILALAGCSDSTQQPPTKLIYFGSDDRSEKPKDAIRLAKTWSDSPPCPDWKATINRRDADYQVLFGDAEQVTVVGKHGELIYSGGEGVLYMPNGNPDGSGVNICRLTSK